MALPSSVRVAFAVVLLAAPTVLAFRSGGYFGVTTGEFGLLTSAVAWLLAALVLALEPRPLPPSRAGRVALAGLAGLAAWTGLSLLWAPVLDPALADAERVLLYLATLLVAGVVLRGAALARAVSPALLAGIGVVCAYALITRLLPGLFDVATGVRAGSRLDQPLTYWNALGALAAVGLVLAMGLAGDPSRGARGRVTAAATAPALGLTLFLTVSRGALVAAVLGVVVLALAARDRRTGGSVVLGVALVAGLAALATRFPAVVELDGDESAREAQGLVVLALLLAACAAGALGQLALIRLEVRGRSWTELLGPYPRAVGGLAALGVVALGVASFAAGDSDPGPRERLAQDPSRLRTLETNRWSYWEVAAESFADDPLLGSGAHGFATEWLERREIDEATQDAHSVYIETLTELGIPGFALLLAFVGGALAAFLRAADPAWTAAATVWLVHAGVDWDWEMPALTLVFVVLVGAAAAGGGAQRASPAEPSRRRGQRHRPEHAQSGLGS